MKRTYIVRPITASASDESAYYEVVVGYHIFIVKVSQSTSDYGAIIDMLIDYLEFTYGEQSNLFVDYDKYHWNGDEDELINVNDPDDIIYPDEYTLGGNHGLVLYHGGNFRIDEISKTEADALVEQGAELVDMSEYI